MAESKASKEIKAMKTQIKIGLTSALVVLLWALGAQGASASFGLEPGSVDATVIDEAGHFEPGAGVHPFGVTSEFKLNSVPSPEPDELGLPISDEGPLRQVTVEAPPGLIGNPTATPRCTLAEFLQHIFDGCSDSAQVGFAETEFNLFGQHLTVPSAIYNLEPGQGQPALFGFSVVFVPVQAVPTIRTDSDYGINFNVVNIDMTVPVTANKFTFWGVPASPVHDAQRGNLFFGVCHGVTSPPCHSDAKPTPFLTSPVDCAHGPFAVGTEVQSWLGHRDSTSILTHDDLGDPAGVDRCDRVPFEPTIESQPSTDKAQSPSGLDFEMEIPDAGLLNPDGLSQALLKKAVVTLPEGYTLNPSAGEGLDYCTEEQYEAEKLKTKPGGGCPNSSKLGTVQIESPLLEPGEIAEGSLFIAQPNDPTRPGQENPFDSLVSMYMVARVVDRAVILKSPGKVDLDPDTGQITTTFDDLPQLPFTSFKLKFREGGRAPLATPSSCGEKATVAKLYPYSAPEEATEVTSISVITAGADGSACPTAGLPPFKPGLIAGTINNAAGRFSPFNLRLTRTDSEQEITHFSIKLPPGLSGKLAGVPRCSDSAIALAKSREHVGGGREEQSSPSCPVASKIGRTLIGAGVGSILTYVPGEVYLAGPYHGSPLSIVAITSGVVGPFDIGTVAVREALQINPETAEVFIDATGSDPIPHITDGIATHIRDLRSYVDRSQFTLNPTDCDRTSTASTVLGAGLDFVSEADDNPITVTTPFQAADCAALPFKPKLSLKLLGGTKRGDHPKFRAILRMRGIGEAAIERAQVTLPRSEFLENAHIKTICTRAQFKAGEGNGTQCPAGSVYGSAKATTPLLDETLAGPVFLRSSEHQLPDLVAALHTPSGIDFNLIGRVDSVKGGGIRNTFEAAPDAPVSSFVLTMQGGKKGLLVNSTNLCLGTHRAEVAFDAHNGKALDSRPALKAKCGKSRKQAKRAR